MKPWLLRRSIRGAYETLVHELRQEDETDYTSYFRMSPTEFDEILGLVEVKITKREA